MKTLLIGLLAIGTLSAHASMLEVDGPLAEKFSEYQVNEESTHFETLGNLYKAGTKPNLAKISNIAWAGRCFNDEQQNEPTNSGYIFRKKRADAGPIATTSKVYEAISYWNLSKAPNYFDQMNIEQIFALGFKNFSDAKIKNNSIEIGYDSSKSNLRVSGNYLVEEITEIEHSLDAKPVITIRCYYFIPDLND
ncbi:MAG: hypothetical protein ACOYL6_15235 [Bacteriovoracaceae bacterium]